MQLETANYLISQDDYGDLEKKMMCIENSIALVLVLDSEHHWETAVPSQPQTICSVKGSYCTRSRTQTLIGKKKDRSVTEKCFWENGGGCFSGKYAFTLSTSTWYRPVNNWWRTAVAVPLGNLELLQSLSNNVQWTLEISVFHHWGRDAHITERQRDQEKTVVRCVGLRSYYSTACQWVWGRQCIFEVWLIYVGYVRGLSIAYFSAWQVNWRFAALGREQPGP